MYWFGYDSLIDCIHPSLAGLSLPESGRSAISSGWRRAGGAWVGGKRPRDRTPKRDLRTVSEQAMRPPLPFRANAQLLLLPRTRCSAWARCPTLVFCVRVGIGTTSRFARVSVRSSSSEMPRCVGQCRIVLV